jgi:hypothetical protein
MSTNEIDIDQDGEFCLCTEEKSPSQLCYELGWYREEVDEAVSD